MKKALVLLVFIFCVFLNIEAQEEKFKEPEAVTALRRIAAEKLNGKSYRVRITSENRGDRKNLADYMFVETTTEFVPPDSFHTISRKAAADSDLTRIETVRIGSRAFVKYNDENWKELPLPNPFGSGNGPAGFSSKAETTVEYQYIGRENIGNEVADLYRIKTVTKDKINDRQVTSTRTESFWFSADGLFLKIEDELVRDNLGLILQTVYEYQYDPKIKIEAPVKNKN